MGEWLGLPAVEIKDAEEGIGLAGKIINSITDIY